MILNRIRYYHGRLSKSKFPPDIIKPTLRPLNNCLFFIISANAIEHEGSTIIFNLSQIIRKELMISSSAIVIISSTRFCITRNVFDPIWARRPSQMVLIVLFGTIRPSFRIDRHHLLLQVLRHIL